MKMILTPVDSKFNFLQFKRVKSSKYAVWDRFISKILKILKLSLIHISEPTRPRLISYAVFCLKKKNHFFLFFKKFVSILFIDLSQTAYFDDLTLLNCRKLNLESTGVNIIFIRAIGCSFMPGEGPI